MQAVITLKSNVMKKLALLVGLVAFTITAFAQSKGEMYVLTSASASFGKVRSDTYNINGSIANTTEEPYDTYLGFDAGFGWFAANNFRLELCLGVSYVKNPWELAYDNDWLYNKFTSFYVCPSLSYYVRLADRFYYAPEVGVLFTFGKYTHEETHSKTWNYPYRDYSLYANLLAFEYRVGPHFALWAGVGCLKYTHRNYFDEGKKFFSSNSLVFDLNSCLVSAHIYF